MPSTYTDILRLTLPTTGELSGTWGTTVNVGVTALIEAAISGTAAVAHTDAADYTLTTANGAADEARQMFLNITGALSAARNVVCPAKSKLYYVRNNTTGGFAITFKTSGGTGVSVPNGKYMALYCDGTNVVPATDYVAALTLGTDLAVADGGTGRSTGTTANALVATGTTATGAQQTLAAGATTEMLVGGGAALPVWTTATGTGAPVRANSPVLVTPTGIVKGDVGLGNVDNTSNTTERAATATLTNKTIAYASNTLTGVQPTLVSGTSIKTVNGNSLLGSGDVVAGPLPVTVVSGTTQTAAAGNHYVLTNAAATTVTLPAGVSGDTVAVTATGTLVTNVIAPNGSETIMETAGSMTLDKVGVTVTLRYLDSSWRVL